MLLLLRGGGLVTTDAPAGVASGTGTAQTVTVYKGPNLVTNPSFATNTTGYTASPGSGFWFTTAAGATITRAAGGYGDWDAYEGQIAFNGAGADQLVYWDFSGTTFYSGTTYSMLFWAKNVSGSGNVQWWFGSKGTNAGTRVNNVALTSGYELYIIDWTPASDYTDVVFCWESWGTITRTIAIDMVWGINPLVLVSANAGLASGTATAGAVIASSGAMSGLASGTGTAQTATKWVGGMAPAASGTGTAQQALASLGGMAPVATGTGSAPQPTVSTFVGTDAAAGVASASGAANTATASVTVFPPVVSAAGTAQQTIPSLGGSAPAATGTGTSRQPTSSIATFPSVASGVGSALTVTVSTVVIALGDPAKATISDIAVALATATDFAVSSITTTSAAVSSVTATVTGVASATATDAKTAEATTGES